MAPTGWLTVVAVSMSRTQVAAWPSTVMLLAVRPSRSNENDDRGAPVVAVLTVVVVFHDPARRGRETICLGRKVGHGALGGGGLLRFELRS